MCVCVAHLLLSSHRYANEILSKYREDRKLVAARPSVYEHYLWYLCFIFTGCGQRRVRNRRVSRSVQVVRDGDGIDDEYANLLIRYDFYRTTISLWGHGGGSGPSADGQEEHGPVVLGYMSGDARSSATFPYA